jgi:hypothetical protein
LHLAHQLRGSSWLFCLLLARKQSGAPNAGFCGWAGNNWTGIVFLLDSYFPGAVYLGSSTGHAFAAQAWRFTLYFLEIFAGILFLRRRTTIHFAFHFPASHWPIVASAFTAG